MKILFIDTSTSCINVYIIDNEKVVMFKQCHTLKNMANNIMPLIRDLINEANLKINNIDKIFVTVGPGSFTGVRIGITVAKTLSYCLSIPVCGISTLEYLASVDTEFENIISILDARSGKVYAGYYDNNLNQLRPDELIEYENIVLPKNSIVVGVDGLYDSKVKEVNILKLLDKHKEDKGINCHLLKPNYIKKIEGME